MVRRTGAATREEIRSAATRLFHEKGYSRTSVRDIAALAEINPALVIRHFGSKEMLFLDTMRLTVDDDPLLDVPPAEFGERFVERLLADDDMRGVYLALVRGSGEPQIKGRLRAIHEHTLVVPVRSRLTGPDADLRARLAAAVVGGLFHALWVVGDAELLAADPKDLVTRYGAVLQRLITPA
ncbi:TetR/AcrR family transcriptional regulator [Actinoplanes siamensis]|uniref:TetR family transcriptional regulator n=1 Tax=Actinoplanes siamensis TaxID=1223317 RepID=A0A919N4P9_9ACTN|nr:TetR family transcriptional regulator [Actinoplanes siamensis]GIF04346.1 TetR family transcriptional regulator [Actinoplanes siamensis]